MTDSKIYQVIIQLKRIEQNRLRKYVQSPYFNANETLVVLLDILLQHQQQNGKAEMPLTKQKIWTLLPETQGEYNDLRFRKHCSDLLSLTENFLSQEVYETDKLQQASYLIEAVTHHKLDKLYNNAERNADVESQRYPYRTSEYYFKQYQIQKNLYDLREADVNRFDKSNIELIINNLDYFYLAEKMRWYSTILNRKNLISHDYSLLFVDEIINHLQKYPYEDILPISLSYLTYQIHIDSPDDSHYFNLKKMLYENERLLTHNENKLNYFYLLNFAQRKLNQGSIIFLKEYLELFKYLLNTDFLLENGQLDPWLFRNVVTIALRLGEYKWTEEFLDSYKNKLPPDQIDNAARYNYATLYFYQKKYEKAIPLLNSVDFNDLGYNLNSKTILIAIYYELDEDNALSALMDSFKTYLNRHKEITGDRRMLYINMIKYTKKLLKLNPGDKTEIAKIRAEIEEDNKKAGVASLRWIYDKLAELE